MKAKQQDLGVPAPALLTVEQAAVYLGASTVWAVRRLIYCGRIPYVQVGKRYNLRKTDLDLWIEKNTRQERVAA